MRNSREYSTQAWGGAWGMLPTSTRKCTAVYGRDSDAPSLSRISPSSICQYYGDYTVI
jgi:hypothetical protein